MKPVFNEETLAAYALDELDAASRPAVAEFAESNAEAGAAINEYRRVATLAKRAMKATPQLELDELRRKRILQQAQAPRRQFAMKRAVGFAVAAVLVLVWATILIPATSQHKAMRASYSAELPQLAVREQLKDIGYMGEPAQEQQAQDSVAFRPEGDAAKGVVRGLPLSGTPPDRYLIKKAFVAIETGDARQAVADFTAQAAALGGFVGNLREETDGLGRHTVMLEVRVPADKLDGTLQALDAFGKVLNKQVNAQDVTEEYVDNESRIRNLTKTEERLLDHLSKTSMIENTLKIESELNRVREQLELIQGRQRVLSHQVAFSSINATFTETPKAESLVPTQTFSVGRVVTDAVRSLLAFGRVVITKMIWIGVWLPVWAPFLLVGWLAWRHYENVRKARPE